MWHKLFRSTTFWLLLSLSVSVIAYWRWFFTFDIFTWGDWGYQNQEFIKSLFYFPQVWHREFMGVIDIGLPQYFTARLLYSAFAQFLPFVGYDRIVFLWPVVLAPTIGIFLLAKQNSQNAFAGFIGVIVYMFNSYILLLYTGHLTLATAYGIAPFVFLLFKKAIQSLSLKHSIGAGLVSILAAVYEPRGFYIISIILFSYLFYTVFLTVNPMFNKTKKKIKALFLGFLPILIVILASAYWIIAAAQTVNSYVGIAINTDIVGKYAFMLPRPFALFSPWWTGNGTDSWGAIQSIPLYFWVIPFVAFLGFWMNRRKADTLFWALIALLGVFLTKSMSMPFGEIYPWLYSHVPGFNLFRDSSKFEFIVCIAYSVLIAEFVTWLVMKTSVNKILKITFTTIIIVIFLYNGTFVVKQQLGHLMTPRHIPQDYITLRNYFLKQNQFFRVLYVPQLSKWVHRDTEHRMLGLFTLSQADWKRLNNYNKPAKEYSIFADQTEIFKKPFANQLLDASSIKYIVVLSEFKEDEENIYPQGTSMKDYEDFLSKLSYLKKIDIGTKKFVVFENSNPLPHYSFSPKVKYEVNCADAMTCTFKFNSSAKSVVFHYAEAYHPGWKIRMGNFSWFTSLFIKNYFMPDSYHTRSKFETNNFYLPQVKSGYEMTLYFAPQAKVNIGTIISILTVITGSIIMIILILKKK